VRWRYIADEQPSTPAPVPRRRSRRTMLAHVDGSTLGAWPLGGVVRQDGRAFRVTRHQGVPPAPDQFDWTYAVWGSPLR